MEKVAKTKLANVATAIGIASTGIRLAQEVKEKYDGRTMYIATVGERSYVFPELMRWLQGQTNTRRVKFVAQRNVPVAKIYDGQGKGRIKIDGVKFTIRLERPDLSKGTGVSVDDYGDSTYAANIVFSTRDPRGMDVLQNVLSTLVNKREQDAKSISLYTLSQYGWAEKDLITRRLESVFLPPGVKEDVIADMENFAKAESRFEAIGIPYHRGYLFYGPPGTGKTSLAGALATHFKKNLYSLSLSAIKDDQSLTSRITEVQKDSILLIEDVDIFSKSMKREQADSGPTLAGLLNALDGVATPHGLIVVMTTNHIESLDSALIRPGRVDKRVELVHPVRSQIAAMFEYVYGEPLRVEAKEFASMAEVSEVFKRNCWSAEDARLEIKSE